MKEKITREKFYPHSIEEVWQAISDQDAISEWFIKAEFKPNKGESYTFTHEATTITGEILEVSPPNLLVYTWIVGGTKAVTTVRWELASKNGGTQLMLEHWGFEDYGDSAPVMFENFSSGWESCMNELETYLKAQATASA